MHNGNQSLTKLLSFCHVIDIYDLKQSAYIKQIKYDGYQQRYKHCQS